MGLPLTLDPAKKHSSITLSGGNLTLSNDTTNSYGGVVATFGVAKPDDKFYYELTLDTAWVGGSPYIYHGVCDKSATYGSSTPWSHGASHSFVPRMYWARQHPSSAGQKVCDETTAGAYTTATNTPGAVFMCALSISTGKVWLGLDGTWYGGGDPAADTNPTCSGLTSKLLTPVVYMHRHGSTTTSAVLTINFGDSAFTYTPPSGFVGFSSANFGGYINHNSNAVLKQHRGVVSPHYLGI